MVHLIIPADTLPDFLLDVLTISVLEETHIRDEDAEIIDAGADTFDSLAVIIDETVIGKDVVGIDASAEKGNTVPESLAETLVGMEFEFEPDNEIFDHGGDFLFEMRKGGGGNNKIKIINVATVGFDFESIDDELVELVEIDVGHKL